MFRHCRISWGINRSCWSAAANRANGHCQQLHNVRKICKLPQRLQSRSAEIVAKLSFSLLTHCPETCQNTSARLHLCPIVEMFFDPHRHPFALPKRGEEAVGSVGCSPIVTAWQVNDGIGHILTKGLDLEVALISCLIEPKCRHSLLNICLKYFG